MTECQSCRQGPCEEMINFGSQPVCHHFYDGAQREGMYPLVLGECPKCGLVQLLNRIAPEQLVPRYDWLVYQEPEHHLNELVSILRALPGISPTAMVCGLSHKDESTLERLRNQGFEKVWRADLGSDLGITDPREGIE